MHFWMMKRDDKLGRESTIQKWLGSIVRTDLDKSGRSTIRCFFLIFSLNIVAIGNVSLRYVLVNFNQIMRSLVPVFAIILGMFLCKEFTMQRLFVSNIHNDWCRNVMLW
jgi:Mn2+/Fe2+ NRAMP family transporter